jgi:hypothetical protein
MQRCVVDDLAAVRSNALSGDRHALHGTVL